jgi:hypothetical protein
MKKVLISFGDQKYYKSLDLLERTSLEIGKVDKFIRYNDIWLKTTDFYKKNSYILNIPRGKGVWLWKIAILYDALSKLEHEDIVCYSDAGLAVIADLSSLYEIASHLPNGGIVLFKLPSHQVISHPAKIWTKRDCFVLMDCDQEIYWNTPMVNAAVSIWVKNDNTLKFLKELEKYMRDIRCISDTPNLCGKQNFIEFKDNRHDQSILTLLSKKYEFELFRDPTQFGNGFKEEFTNSPYGQLFNHHRGNI